MKDGTFFLKLKAINQKKKQKILSNKILRKNPTIWTSPVARAQSKLEKYF